MAKLNKRQEKLLEQITSGTYKSPTEQRMEKRNTNLNKKQAEAKSNTNNDIAPVKTNTVETKKDNRNIFQKIGSTVMGVSGNFLMGIEGTIPKATKYITEGTEYLAKKAGTVVSNSLLGVLAPSMSDKEKEVTSKIISGFASNQALATSTIGQMNKQLNSKEKEKWRNETIQKNTERASAGGKVGEFANDVAIGVGQNIIPMAIGFIPGGQVLSLGLFTTSSGGSYLEDAEQRGMNEDEKMGYATVMGIWEGGGDYLLNGLNVNRVTKLFGAGEVFSKKALQSAGFSAIENAIQEGLTEPVNEKVADIFGGYGEWEDMGSRMLRSALVGAVSGVILDGAGKGIGGAVYVANVQNNTNNAVKTAEQQLGRELTAEEIKGIKKQVKEHIKAQMVDMEDLSAEEKKKIESLATMSDEDMIANVIKEVKDSGKVDTDAILKGVNEAVSDQTKAPVNQEQLQAELIKKQEELAQTEDVREKEIIQDEINAIQEELAPIEQENSKKTYTEMKQDAEKEAKQVVAEIERNLELEQQAETEAEANRIRERINELEEQLAPLQEQLSQENTDNYSKEIAELENLKSKYDSEAVQKAVDNQIKKLKEDSRVEVQGTPASQEVVEAQGKQDFETLTDEDIAPTNEGTQVRDVAISSDTTDIKTRIKDTFGLKNKETEELYKKVAKVDSIEQVREVLEDYKDITEKVHDDEVKKIRDTIRNTKLDASKMKSYITDYNDFRKSNMGKLKLGKDGVAIDTFYQELASSYPEYFDNDVANVADQIEILSDFMNNNKTDYVQKIGEIEEADLQRLSEELYAEVHANEFNNNEEYQKSLDSLEAPTEQLREEATEELKAQVNDLKDEISDLKKQLKETITPIKEAVKTVNKAVETVQENVAPVQEVQVQETTIENKVQDYINKNNLNMTIDEFMNRFKGMNVEAIQNMTAEQQELFDLIKEIQANTVVTDNQGRKLSKEQQEYFKESVVKDNKGNLLTMYHGTRGEFYTFEKNRAGQNYEGNWSSLGKGFYFSTEYETAKDYGSSSVNEGETTVKEVYLDIKHPFDAYGDYRQELWDLKEKYNLDDETLSKGFRIIDVLNQNGHDSTVILQEHGYDGIIQDDEYVVFNSNQIKNIDNKKPTNDSDIRYSLSEEEIDNSEVNAVDRQINQTMTMAEAKDMIQRAFAIGNIYNWFDGQYKNGDEWLKGEGADSVALVIENEYQLQQKFLNKMEGLNDDYVLEDVLEAYQNGTLTGKQVENTTSRLDLTTDTGFIDDKFYSPKGITADVETYKKASQRVTNANRQEVYKARADFITNAHNKGYIESIGLTQQEVNQKLKSWANYTKKAMDMSNYFNEGVSTQNRWTGIENSSIVNALTISEQDLNNMVKEVRGANNEWQRRYITNTMLALDTHINYKGLSFEFGRNVEIKKTALGAYSSWDKTIRIREDGQNTVAHETGHYVDNIWGEEIFGRGSLTDRNSVEILQDNEIKQWVTNFYNFLDNIENSSDIRSGYTMSSNEVFARFVARFVEWTKNVATNNRYGYETKWYNDNFTESQYREFVKLLQEKAKLDTTKSNMYSEKVTKSDKVSEDRIDDVFNNLFNEKQTDDVTEGKQRKWVKTSTDSEVVNRDILPDNLDQEAIHYIPITNKETLNKANARLDIQGYDEAVKSFNNKIYEKKVTVEDIALGERLIQEALKRGDKKTAGELIQNIAILGTDLGQKVQALSIIQRMTPEGQLKLLEKTINRAKAKGDKAFKDVTITDNIRNEILDVYDENGGYSQEELNKAVDKAKQEIADQMEATTLDKVNAWRYLAMLGNPKTHIRNLVSNVAMRGTSKVKNALARTIETIAPIETKTKTWKPATQEIKDYAKQTTIEMKDIISGENQYGEETGLKQLRQIFKNKVLEGIYNFNSNLLEKEDWWFSSVAFKDSLSEYLTANGIKTKEDIQNNPKVVEKAKQYAVEQAQIATFRQYSWLANKIREIENKNTATQIAVGSVLPFKRTPINIAKAGLNYSPLGFAKTLTYDISQVKKGNMEASTLVDHLAQNTTGSALALVGYMLAMSGFLNGAGDDDDEGKYDYQLGKQAYSVNIGDNTYSLSWLSPVAMPLFVGVNAYEQLVEGKEWNGDVVVETLSKTLDPLNEMSFMSSLTQMLSSYDTGVQKFAGMFETMAQSYITQFLPTLSSQIAGTLDDTKRSTKVGKDSSFKFFDETVNKIKYKIPILRETLEPSTDIWGNEIKQTEDIMQRAYENFISPYARKESIATEIDNEIKDVFSMTGDNGVIPDIPKNTIKFENVDYDLTAKEYTTLKKTYGQIANDLLEDLFRTSTYKNADPEEKAEMINNVYSYAGDISRKQYFEKYGVEYTNATEDGEKVYKEKAIKGAIDNDMYIDEYKMYRDNPDKYEFLQNENISWKEYEANTEEYNFYYKSPEKYLVGTAVTDFNNYLGIRDTLNDFSADKDEEGKSISGSKKEKVISYINSLELNIPQKAMLIKSEYSSFTDYNNEIVQYVSGLDIDYNKKKTILESLDMTVSDDGTVSWKK